MEQKPKIKIILGSTRQGRNGDRIGHWISSQAKNNTNIDVELLDLRDYPMPFFEEAISPAYGEVSKNEAVQRFSQKISEADGVIVVSPEYNHGYTAVLKNALDQLYYEWNDKPVAIVSYGGVSGGLRAAEQLKQVFNELKMYVVHEAVIIPFVWEALDEEGNVKGDMYKKSAEAMVNSLEGWAKFFKTKRG